MQSRDLNVSLRDSNVFPMTRLWRRIAASTFERLLHHDDAAAIVIDPFFGSGSIPS